MIAVDTNLLVYAHRTESPFHAEAKERVESLRSGRAMWAIPWPVVHEFLGVVTNPRIFRTPTPRSVAVATVDALTAGGTLQLLAESEGYWAKLTSLIAAARVEGARIHDARVAALCLHHGVSELWTADRDFSLFPALKTRNPLVSVAK
ncbi:MAG: PIN domain-containing protein [Archangium sp.]|nr:PIN domain-containing protein [Archangium sp.]